MIDRMEVQTLNSLGIYQHKKGIMTTDGLEISGALELVPGLSAVLFRPDEALPDGVELELSAQIDNDAIDDMQECNLYTPDVMHTVLVVEGSMADFELDALEIESRHEIAQHVSYDSLVCCDGAYPADLQNSCGWAEIDWSPGFCTATRGTGYAIASLALPSELDEPALNNLLVRLVADDDQASRALASTSGSLQLQRPSLFAAHYEVVNLATGDLMRSEAVDVGADVLDALGELDIDPASALAAACSGEAYVCETDESGGEGQRRWDPEQCVAYEGEPEETDGPDSDGETDPSASGGTSDLEDRGGGCSCNAEGGSPRGLGLLALLGLGGVGVRRRRR